MGELLEFSFAPANILPTALLLLVAVYWLVFVVGLLDLSFLDFDIDHDLDVDHDVHVEAGHDVDHHGPGHDIDKDIDGHGFFFKFLTFFNIGHVPFMVFFSFFAVFYWAATVLGNYYWANGSAILIVLVLIGGFVAAAFAAKFVTQPLRHIFKKLKSEEKVELLGSLCRIEISPEGNMMGQAVLNHKTRSINLNVRSESGKKIPKGTQCVVLEKVEEGDYFLVAPMEEEQEGPPSP